MKILVTGSSGMLAYDLIPILKEKYEVVGYDREDFDITNLSNIENVLKKEKINLIVNCAAYTDVEKAEEEGNLLNYQVNALGPYNLGKICNKLDIDCIHISTDYVFDGTKKEGYLPNDKPNPINQYGMAKYLGEQLLRQEFKNAIIIRTSRLYGGGKQFKNFVNTMISLSENKKEISVVSDQFGAPTYTKDLSKGILQIIENIKNNRSKTFHLSNETKESGISWFDFASEIFKILGKNVSIINSNSDEFPTKAKRPKYSKLNNIDMLSYWTIGLTDYLN